LEAKKVVAVASNPPNAFLIEGRYSVFDACSIHLSSFGVLVIKVPGVAPEGNSRAGASPR